MNFSERHLVDASDIPAGLTVLRCDGRTVDPLYANDEFFRLVGYQRRAAAGEPYPEGILNSEGWRSFTSQLLARVQDGETLFDVDARQKTGGGAALWTRTRCRYDTARQQVVCVVMDATSTMEASNRLRMSEDAFRIAVRMSGKSIGTYDVASRTLTIENAMECQVSAPLVQGDMPESTIAAGGVAPESVEEYRSFYRGIHDGAPRGSAEVRMRDFATGEFRWLRADYSTVFDAEGRPASAVVVFGDVTEQREREQAQRALAERDALTGALNRAAFEQRCADLAKRTPPGRMHAFVMADLDRLKSTNDRFGHAAGDEAIAAAAQALKGVLRESDLMGRIGGDEFMICLRDVKSRDDAGAVARRLCKAVEDGNCGGEDEDAPTVSLGIALFPQDGTTYEELYHRADVAMYRAKREGGGRFDFYSNEG